jgi:hypothetical protein
VCEREREREREREKKRERYVLWSTEEVASVSNGNTKISAKVSSVCCVWERENQNKNQN